MNAPLVRKLAPPLPAGVVLGLWFALLPASGGFFARDWYPTGLALLALGATLALGGRPVLPAARAAHVALALLAGLVAWNALSIVWADAPGAAWQDTNLLLVYVLMAWLLVTVPWTAGWASLLLGAFGAGTAVVCGLTLVEALGTADLSNVYLTEYFDFRWAEPLGYPNGIAALAVIAALGPLVLSTRDELGVGWNAAALGVGTFLAGFALLPQSRGSVLGAAAAVAVTLALAPWRWRLVWRLGVVGLALIFVAGPVFDVLDAAAAGRDAVPALEGVAARLAIAAAVAAIAGVALTLVEQRVVLDPEGERRARLAGVTVLCVLVAACGVATVVKSGAIADRLSDQWHALLNPGSEFSGSDDEAESSRLLDADPLQRYDYFRVAFQAFRDAPVGGLGAGGFDPRYTRERRYEKYSSYPHNLPLRLLSENGIVGAGLALALLVVLVAGLLRGVTTDSVPVRAVTAASAGMLAYFLVHGQFDWIEAFPVIAAPVLAFALVAVELRHREREPHAPAVRISSRTATAGVAALAVILAASLAAPYLATRYRERARQTWQTDAAAAYRDLDRAIAVDPLSELALVQKGTVALRRGELARARAAFEESLGRRDGWLARFELAVVEAVQGDRRAATRQLDRARVLNPLEPAIPAARREIASGKKLDPAKLNRRLFDSPLFNAGSLP